VQRRIALVLNHHVLNCHKLMTLVAFQNGKPILRNGAIATEQACCCDKDTDTCENNSCFFSGGFANPTSDGDCDQEAGCHCETDPEGQCVDPSVLTEGNELAVPLNEAPLRGYCFSCPSAVVFSMLAAFADPGGGGRPRSEAAAEWVGGVAAWMQASGYTDVRSFNVFCSKGGSSEEEVNNVVWVRACCDGEFSQDTDDCYDVYDSEPADSFGLTPQVNPPGGGNPCAGPGLAGAGPWIPTCLPNPLP
jgi:hypothetical protein